MPTRPGTGGHLERDRHYPSTSTDNGPFAYVTDATAGTVNVVDSSTQTIVGNPITVGTTPESVVVTPDGADVFVANGGSGTVSEIATSTNTVVATITLSGVTRLALAPGGATLYAIAGGKLYPIDLATDAVGRSIAGVSGGDNLAITPDGTKGFVCHRQHRGSGQSGQRHGRQCHHHRSLYRPLPARDVPVRHHGLCGWFRIAALPDRHPHIGGQRYHRLAYLHLSR